ncbi:MAG: peptidoglycan binding protein CsiV [Vibrionaceae bacterium]|nr:peptidoglycan binding protein CsiV [Vibrionaceae bacterium]
MKKLIPLLLLFVALPSWAQRQFDIEVIIFKRDVNPEQTEESWPNTLPKIELEKAGTFADSDFRSRKGVRMLPYSSYQLTDDAQRLKQHAGFNVLFHKAWRQGDRGRLSAPIFHIQAGKEFSDAFNADGSAKGSRQGAEVIDGVQEQNVSNSLYELDGTFQIYVEHYLYADVKMDLKAPSVREVVLQEPVELESDKATTTPSDSVVQAGLMEEVQPTVEKQEFLKSYRIDQKRRMKSSETHYLDHPLMGMIIQVRRVN